jgi:hypothetical protein
LTAEEKDATTISLDDLLNDLENADDDAMETSNE